MGVRHATLWLAILSVTAAAAPPVMTNLNPSTRPSSRTGPACALDAAAPERLWLFGGNATLAGTNNQLWAYDVAANTWAQRTVTGTTPSNRAWAVLSWDVAQQRLVLFGGSSDLNGPLLSDIRLFDPATDVWSTPTVSGTLPTARFLARMVYVPHLGRHLLFGGGTATNGQAEATALTNELWSLTVSAAANTATWQLLTPGGTAPPPRASPCVGYDPVRRRLIVYGGELVNANIGDVAQYDVDGNAWSIDAPTGTVPGTRGAVLCTFDQRTRKLVVYGGTMTPSGTPQGGAFTYQPEVQQWTQVMPGTTPGARTSGGMAYSPTAGGMLFFGGRSSLIAVSQETWSMRVNAAPQLTPPMMATVDESDPVMMSASATDADSADGLTWSWGQLAGPMVTLSSTSIAAPGFIAPRVTANTVLRFLVNVTDGTEAKDAGVQVTVRDSINEPPSAEAGADRSVNEGQLVRLDGTASSDPNLETLTYQWVQQAGPSVTLSQPNTAMPFFTAPSFDGGTVLRFQLTVTDPRMGRATDSLNVTVVSALGDAGTPDAGAGGGAAGGASGGSAAGGASGGGAAGGASGGGAAGGASGGGAAGGTSGGGAAGGAGGGSADDGGLTDGGLMADAGPGERRQLRVGCGCTTHGAAPWSLVLLELLVLLRPRNVSAGATKVKVPHKRGTP